MPPLSSPIIDEARRRTALVVSRHAATLRNVSHGLGAIDLEVWSAASLDELATIDPTLVVLDLDADPTLDPVNFIDATLARAGGSSSRTTVVAVAGPGSRRRLVRALAHPAVAHIIPKAPGFAPDPEAPMQYLGPDERELYVALHRRESRATGVAPYLAGGAPVSLAEVGDATMKDETVAMIVALGERMRLGAEKLRRIEILAEELLENALYDAPTDGQGGRRAERRVARTTIHLSPGERVKVRWGSDGRAFALSVTDPFGSLAKTTLTDHLGKLLAPGGITPAHGSGGAGLGLVMAYDAANQLAFTLSPGRRTEVTAVVDVAGSNRSSLERGTAVHIYRSDEEP